MSEKPDILERELFELLKTLKNILKVSIGNQTLLMSKFQEVISKISSEHPAVTLIQKQTILARKIADVIYQEYNSVNDISDISTSVFIK